MSASLSELEANKICIYCALHYSQSLRIYFQFIHLLSFVGGVYTSLKQPYVLCENMQKSLKAVTPWSQWCACNVYIYIFALEMELTFPMCNQK